MQSAYAISVENVGKQYGDFQALKSISLSVEWGEIYGFLGPNGAGKSTLIQILTTLMVPTTGFASIAGYDVLKHPEGIRRQIGVALQDTGVDPMLTGRELLVLQGRLFGFSRAGSKARAAELLEQFGLMEAADKRIKTYSGGMRRRLDLALALVHRPPILFLDEPTTGLDPVNRNALWRLLKKVQQDTGVTVFLTTQYLEEADALANHIGIINHGSIIAEDTPQILKRRMKRDIIELEGETATDREKLYELLRGSHAEVTLEKDMVRLQTPHGASSISEILRQVEESNITLAGLKVAPPTLDDVFLELTGETTDAADGKEDSTNE